MITKINEVKTLAKHISCDCKLLPLGDLRMVDHAHQW